MLINKRSKGTIILSHYRAGGSQMRQILEQVGVHHYGLDVVDKGEVNFNGDTNNLKKEIDDIFYSDEKRYQVFLLNNATVISFLFNINYFKQLVKDYHIISLERKDKIKCILSLPLWEEFIDIGFYDKGQEGWTKENMQIFHNKLIETPLSAPKISLGYNTAIKEDNNIEYLNETLKNFTAEIATNRTITSEYNLIQVYYEEYENNMKEFVNNYFNNIKDFVIERMKNTRIKIPYIAENYLDYFDNTVKDLLRAWNIESKA